MAGTYQWARDLRGDVVEPQVLWGAVEGCCWWWGSQYGGCGVARPGDVAADSLPTPAAGAHDAADSQHCALWRCDGVVHGQSPGNNQLVDEKIKKKKKKKNLSYPGAYAMMRTPMNPEVLRVRGKEREGERRRRERRRRKRRRKDNVERVRTQTCCHMRHNFNLRSDSAWLNFFG